MVTTLRQGIRYADIRVLRARHRPACCAIDTSNGTNLIEDEPVCGRSGKRNLWKHRGDDYWWYRTQQGQSISKLMRVPTLTNLQCDLALVQSSLLGGLMSNLLLVLGMSMIGKPRMSQV